MKNRVIVLALAILLNPLLHGAIQVRIPDVNGLPGTPVIIPIMVDDATQISTMFFSLEFDSTVLTVAGKDDLVKGDLLADHSAGAGVKSGKVNVTIFSSSRASFKVASGTAAQVVADIDFGAGFGSNHALTLSNVAAYDSSGTELATQVTAGTLNITNQPNTTGTVSGASRRGSREGSGRSLCSRRYPVPSSTSVLLGGQASRLSKGRKSGH